MCMEFLLGRNLKSTLFNLKLDTVFKEVLAENKINIDLLKQIFGEYIDFLFESNNTVEKYDFLESEGEFEENDNFSIEDIIIQYCNENSTSLDDMSYHQMSELVKLLSKKYKISKIEIQKLLKISRYMTYKLLK